MILKLLVQDCQFLVFVENVILIVSTDYLKSLFLVKGEANTTMEILMSTFRKIRGTGF